MKSDLPTPGYGGILVYAGCGGGNAASPPFGNPCGGIDKCSASKLLFIEYLKHRNIKHNITTRQSGVNGNSNLRPGNDCGGMPLL